MDTRVKTAIGPTILLQSGSYFDFLDPAGSSFGIEDIAHGLAMTCRFAGQCREFYSVAEHSVLASRLVPEEIALEALMHDAAEAFIGDVTRPLKRLLPEYKRIEQAVEAAVADRFGLDPDVMSGEAVKKADLWLLHCEQQAMMPAHADTWSTSTDLPDLGPVTIRHLRPVEARRQFLCRFGELIRERG